jgi:PAS domain S-box-containing protein
VSPPSIHTRVIAAFTLLILIAAIQVAVVIAVDEHASVVSLGTAKLLLTLIPVAELIVVALLLLATRRAVFLPRATVATSAREQAETAAAHQDLLAIINTVPAALVILNRDGSVRLQNNAAEYLLGPPPQTDVERQAYWQRFAMRDAAGRSRRVRDLAPVRALTGAEVLGEEMEVHRPDGRTATILVSAAPLRDESGQITGVAAGFQDITRLRELDRMKDDFVSIVSHELRTPLTAIRGSLQLLLADERAVPDADDRQFLQVALKSCERLVRIVSDILDISKIEAGQLRLQLTPLQAADVLQTSIQGVQPIADEARVHLRTDIASHVPAVLADADRLTQALVNLLSNAIKFAPPHTEVTASVRRDGDGIVFSVQDRGMGISPEDSDRLFQKFHQLGSSGTRRVGGTGLGLAITKGIVEEHGGTISVESGVGRGTVFRIRIPIARQDAGDAPRAPVRTPSAPLRILIVDDDRDTRMILRMALETDGFEVLEAGTGREGVDAAAEQLPDAITLDLVMPNGDGRWVLSQLQANPLTARIPVIVVSGADPDHTVTSGPILHKPFDPTDLVTTVRGVLAGRTTGRVLVADPDAEIRRVLRDALCRIGCSVVEASDGREALEKVGRDEFDLVLLDLQVPQVHGYDVIRALRDPSLRRRVPIIVLSGNVGEQQSLQSLVLGANVFLAKPPDPTAIAEQVERLLRPADETTTSAASDG